MSDDRKSKHPPKDKSRRCIQEKNPNVPYFVTCIPMEAFMRTPTCTKCYWLLTHIPQGTDGTIATYRYKCENCDIDYTVNSSDVGIQYRRAE